jgi:hypothetical protein
VRALILAYRIIGGLVVAAFCLCHLGSLLEWNLRYPLGDERFEAALGQDNAKRLHDITGRWLRVLACEQRWNMFSNVGSESEVPLVVLYRKDGNRVLLHSELEPALPNAPPGADYLGGKLSAGQREAAPLFNFGNGRIRKAEDNMLEGPQGLSWARMAYVRMRLRDYLEAEGGTVGQFVRIELLRLQIIHAGDDAPARIGGAYFVSSYDWRLDPRWPKP